MTARWDASLRDQQRMGELLVGCPLCHSYLKPRGFPPHVAISVAMHEFVVTRDELLGKQRLSHLVKARAFVVWVLRTLGKPTSYPKLGVLMNRDHSSVVHLHKRAIWLRLKDADFDAACLRIAARFNEYQDIDHGHC